MGLARGESCGGSSTPRSYTSELVAVVALMQGSSDAIPPPAQRWRRQWLCTLAERQRCEVRLPFGDKDRVRGAEPRQGATAVLIWRERSPLRWTDEVVDALSP